MQKTAAIIGFPMPISINNAYRNVPGVGRVKTTEYKNYGKIVRAWMLRGSSQIWTATDLLKPQLKPGYALRIDRSYNFDPARIITLEGKPRRCDTSNYIKCLDDVLAECLSIDDCWFWDGDTRKMFTHKPGENESVDIILSIMEMPPVPAAHRTPEAVMAAARLRKRT